ncbi:MAG: hypothetical protein ABSA18_13735 [Dehalococcoidia bacterium]|jgi:rubrerythrin
MTTKISPYKLTRLLTLHFQGYGQVQIAQKLNIDQSTVSLYIARFCMQSQEEGLMAASKEAGIMNLIAALHSLAAELKASKLTAEEGKLGLKTRLKLEKYGVEEERYPELIQATAKMKDAGFLESALKLALLEKQTGMSYGEITEKYEAVMGQIEQQSKKLDDFKAATAKQQSALKSIEDKREVREKEWKAYLQQTGMNMMRINVVEKLSAILKKSGVKDSELETYIQRQQELDTSDVDIKLFGKIAHQAAATTSVDGGKQLLSMLTEYGGLQATIGKLNADKMDLEKQSAGLREKVNEKNRIVAEIGRLATQRSVLTAEVKDLQGKAKIKDRLEFDIKSLDQIRQEVEIDVKSLQNQKSTLEDEVVATKSKLTELQPLKTEHQELIGKIAGLDKVFTEKSKQFELFKAFLGFLQNTTTEALDKFIRLAPGMVQWAKEGKHSTELIEKRLLDHLTMGQMNVYSCMVCDTRFFVDSAPKWKEKFICPNCNNDVAVVIKTNAHDLLSQMAGKPIQGRPIYYPINKSVK